MCDPIMQPRMSLEGRNQRLEKVVLPSKTRSGIAITEDGRRIGIQSFPPAPVDKRCLPGNPPLPAEAQLKHVLWLTCDCVQEQLHILAAKASCQKQECVLPRGFLP